MIHIPSTTLTVGSTQEERSRLGRQYGFHPTRLGNELEAREVTIEEFWIDRYSVTNRQYAAYLQATGRELSPHWDPALSPSCRGHLGDRRGRLCRMGWQAPADAPRRGSRFPGCPERACPCEFAEGVEAPDSSCGRSPQWYQPAHRGRLRPVDSPEETGGNASNNGDTLRL